MRDFQKKGMIKLAIHFRTKKAIVKIFLFQLVCHLKLFKQLLPHISESIFLFTFVFLIYSIH